MEHQWGARTRVQLLVAGSAPRRAAAPVELSAANSLPVQHSHAELGVALPADAPTCKVLLEEIKVLLAQLD